MAHRSGPVDVLVIGAGLAGTSTAIVLARCGIGVRLIDARPTCPNVFRAEKLEPQHLDWFDGLGLTDTWRSSASSISEIWHAAGGRLTRRKACRQMGLPYADLVNRMRAHLEPDVDVRIGQVTRVIPDRERPRVVLATGEVHDARLVVLATGMGALLDNSLGLRTTVLVREQSLAFGFDIVEANRGTFPFDALTYWPDGHATRIAFLSIFRMPGRMRANLFTYWRAREPRAGQFLRAPSDELALLLPGLTAVVGEFGVVERPIAARIDLSRKEGRLPPGVLLIADAWQNACPTTGDGVTKTLSDVIALAALVPSWLDSSHIDPSRLQAFYDVPTRAAVDHASFSRASYARRLATDRTVGWRARRTLRSWLGAYGDRW